MTQHSKPAFNSVAYNKIFAKVKRYEKRANRLLNSNSPKNYLRILGLTERALKLIPTDSGNLTHRAAALYHLGEKEQAKALLNMARMAYNISADADNILADIYYYSALSFLDFFETNEEQIAYEKARNYFLLLLKTEYKPAAVHHGLARLYTEAGYFDDADFHFRQSLSFEPNSFNVLMDYGVFCEEKGCPEQAEFYFQDAYRKGRPQTASNRFKAISSLFLLYYKNDIDDHAEIYAKRVIRYAEKHGFDDAVGNMMDVLFQIKSRHKGWNLGVAQNTPS